MAIHLPSAIGSLLSVLSEEEKARVYATLLDEIAKRLATGEQLALVKERTDGSVELSVLGLETAEGHPQAVYEQVFEGATGRLSVAVPFPALMAIDDFIDKVVTQVKSLDFLYSVLALVGSGSPDAIHAFIAFLMKQTALSTLQKSDLQQFLSRAEIQSLRIISLHYGSPASFDLLGIGKILEVIRDIIKDIAWRGGHEKIMAELERTNKQTEILRSKLETEKTTVDIAARKIELEKNSLELVLQKLELLEKVSGLAMAGDEKELIVSMLAPKILSVATSGATLQLGDGKTAE